MRKALRCESCALNDSVTLYYPNQVVPDLCMHNSTLSTCGDEVPEISPTLEEAAVSDNCNTSQLNMQVVGHNLVRG